MIRTSTFHVAEFGAEHFTTIHDVNYDSRDREKDSERGRRAFIAATLTLRDPAALHTPVTDLKSLLLREHFNDITIKGIDTSFTPNSLRFDSKWLNDSKTHLAEKWCSLHRGLANSSGSCNKYDIMSWLSTMAYADSADMSTIQTLLAFHRLHDLAPIKPPSASHYDLWHGNTWNASEIQSIIHRTMKSYSDSAEARLPRQGSETNKQHLSRIRSLFNNRQNAAAQNFLTALGQQWPVRQPAMPSLAETNTYLGTSAAMTNIRNKFKTWWDNREFLEYLNKVSMTMTHQTVLKISTSRYMFTAPTTKAILSDDVRHFGLKNIFSAVLPPTSRERTYFALIQYQPT